MEGFSDTFATEEMILDETVRQSTEGFEDFDPFQIGVASKLNKKSTDANAGMFIPIDAATGDDNKSIKSTSSALPPRIMVKLQLEEEVSSIAHLSDRNQGSSEVQIMGTVMAQVVSSDAMKNIPFFLVSSNDSHKALDFISNNTYAKKFHDPDDEKNGITTNVVNVPKEVLGFVTVGKYRLSQSMEHMPLLLEQKVVRSKSKFHIAIQVRSKLTNPDDLSGFSIVVFIPKQVSGDSVSIVTGEGQFDPWKRCITWEKDLLPKGQSFMVGAKCLMDEAFQTPDGVSTDDEDSRFPVMLRCRSKDQISSVRFQALAANGHPAAVSSSVVGQSYRIVHRLN
mmetsp:Transcript_17075/g.39005  ORF Transcript_17075/g.39005 Transcript_17075/m.39005 type:complete len:338 (+) Transcript_17075:97-1110(+)